MDPGWFSLKDDNSARLASKEVTAQGGTTARKDKPGRTRLAGPDPRRIQYPYADLIKAIRDSNLETRARERFLLPRCAAGVGCSTGRGARPPGMGGGSAGRHAKHGDHVIR